MNSEQVDFFDRSGLSLNSLTNKNLPQFKNFLAGKKLENQITLPWCWAQVHKWLAFRILPCSDWVSCTVPELSG